MSYDISLVDPVSREVLTVEVEHYMRGGTYEYGGTDELWLNVTYNYAPIFHKVLGESGIRCIYGKSGAESIPLLEKAIAKLGNDVNPDYWKATEGGAKRVLYQLKAMAQMRPDGIWDGD